MPVSSILFTLIRSKASLITPTPSVESCNSLVTVIKIVLLLLSSSTDDAGVDPDGSVPSSFKAAVNSSWLL